MKKIINEIGVHSAIYFIGQTAGVIASIVLLPVYTRFLAKNDYGVLEMTDSIVSIATIILLSGLGQAIAKLYFDAESELEKKQVYGTIFLFSCIVPLILFAFSLFFLSDITKLCLGSSSYTRQIFVMLCILVTAPSSTIVTNYLNLQKKPVFVVNLSLVRLVVNIFFNLYFIVHMKLGSLGMLLGELISRLLLLAFLSIYHLKKDGFQFHFPLIVKAIKFGAPFIPAFLFGALMHRSDRYIIQKFCSIADVGLYGIGIRFPFLLSSVLLGSFGQIWNSTALYELGKGLKGAETQAKLATYFFIIVLLGEVAVAMFGRMLLTILTTEEYYSALSTMQIVSISMIIYGLHNFFYTGAMLKNKTWVFPVVYGLSTVSSIVLNWIFIPKYGFHFASWNTLITYTLFTGLMYIFCNKYFPVHYEFKKIFTLFIFAIILILAGNATSLDNWILDSVKQFLLFLTLPLILLFGPFFQHDEIQFLVSALNRIHPKIGEVILMIRKPKQRTV